VNISLTKEAYEYLKRLKGKNRSFSDVVLEFKDRKVEVDRSGKALLKFAGISKRLGGDRVLMEKRIREFRESFHKRLLPNK